MKNYPIFNIKQNSLEKKQAIYISPLVLFKLETLQINGEINTTKFTTLVQELTLFPESGYSIIL